MQQHIVVGQHIWVIIIDPWELTMAGGEARKGIVVALEGHDLHAAHIRLDQPITHDEKRDQYFFAAARCKDAGLTTTPTYDGAVVCNFMAITEAEARSKPRRPPASRDRLRFIGDLHWKTAHVP